MIILQGDGDVVAIEDPGLGVAIEVHINLWPSDSNSHFAGAKYHSMAATPVANNIYEALEAFSRVRCDISVISNATATHDDVIAELEAQIGLVDGGEAGIYICLLYTSPSPRDS